MILQKNRHRGKNIIGKDYVSADKRTGSIMGHYIDSGKGFSEYLQSLGYDGIIYNSYNYDTNKADKKFCCIWIKQLLTLLLTYQ